MNAVSHAATALLIRKAWPDVPLWLALISVQCMELMWVVLNLAGMEHTATAVTVHSIADIDLHHMPYSHSVAGTALVAAAAWSALRYLVGRPAWATAAAAGVVSHLVLDLLVHLPDIEILPGATTLRIGTGLYGWPAWAFVVELAYGVLCWHLFQGSRALLAAIVGFDLLAMSFYLPGFAGPETWLAGRPLWFAVLVLVHVVTTLWAIGMLAHPRRGGRK